MLKVAACDDAVVTAGGSAVSLAELTPRPAALQELADYCGAMAGLRDPGHHSPHPSFFKRLLGQKGS
jgi:hypothetical protein